MTLVQHLAAFAHNATYEQLSAAAVEQLKIRVLDSLGCALGALGGEPIRMLRAHLSDFGGMPYCSLIGGGEEGEKKTIRTKEEADHSLPYMTAAMLLDGQVLPGQYAPERIAREDVQALLQKVEVRERSKYSARFPEEMPSRLRVHLKGGRVLEKEKDDYEGFHTRPMTWEAVREKFEQLARPVAGGATTDKVEDAVANLEALPVSRLTELLVRIGRPALQPA